MGGSQRRHGMAHGAAGAHHGSWGAEKSRNTQGRVVGASSYQEWCEARPPERHHRLSAAGRAAGAHPRQPHGAPARAARGRRARGIRGAGAAPRGERCASLARSSPLRPSFLIGRIRLPSMRIRNVQRQQICVMTTRARRIDGPRYLPMYDPESNRKQIREPRLSSRLT